MSGMQLTNANAKAELIGTFLEVFCYGEPHLRRTNDAAKYDINVILRGVLDRVLSMPTLSFNRKFVLIG